MPSIKSSIADFAICSASLSRLPSNNLVRSRWVAHDKMVRVREAIGRRGSVERHSSAFAMSG